jgi:hypothetical protein
MVKPILKIDRIKTMVYKLVRAAVKFSWYGCSNYQFLVGNQQGKSLKKGFTVKE